MQSILKKVFGSKLALAPKGRHARTMGEAHRKKAYLPLKP
jgi:hypothetical protein